MLALLEPSCLLLLCGLSCCGESCALKLWPHSFILFSLLCFAMNEDIVLWKSEVKIDLA
jgi:hypothetical protein